MMSLRPLHMRTSEPDPGSGPGTGLGHRKSGYWAWTSGFLGVDFWIRRSLGLCELQRQYVPTLSARRSSTASRSRYLVLLFPPRSDTKNEYRWRVRSTRTEQSSVQDLQLRTAVDQSLPEGKYLLLILPVVRMIRMMLGNERLSPRP